MEVQSQQDIFQTQLSYLPIQIIYQVVSDKVLISTKKQILSLAEDIYVFSGKRVLLFGNIVDNISENYDISPEKCAALVINSQKLSKENYTYLEEYLLKNFKIKKILPKNTYSQMEKMIIYYELHYLFDKYYNTEENNMLDTEEILGNADTHSDILNHQLDLDLLQNLALSHTFINEKMLQNEDLFRQIEEYYYHTLTQMERQFLLQILLISIIKLTKKTSNKQEKWVKILASNAATLVNFFNGNFSGYSLKGVIIENSQLKNAIFESSDLQNASFKDSDLQNCIFLNSNLENCNFQNSKLNFFCSEKKRQEKRQGSIKLHEKEEDPTTNLLKFNTASTIDPGSQQSFCQIQSKQDLKSFQFFGKQSSIDQNSSYSYCLSSFALCPNREIIALGKQDGSIQIHNMQTFKIISQYQEHTSEINWLRVQNTTGQYMGSCSVDGEVKIWNMFSVEKGNKKSSHTLQKNGDSIVSDLEFANQQAKVALAIETENIIKIFDLDYQEFSLQYLLKFADLSLVKCIKFSENDEILISGGSSGILRLWNIEDGHQIRYSPQREVKNGIIDIKWNYIKKYICTLGCDNSIKIWKINEGINPDKYKNLAYDIELLTSIVDSQYQIYAIALSDCGNLIACSSSDKYIRLFESKTGELLFEKFEGVESRQLEFGQQTLISSNQECGQVRVYYIQKKGFFGVKIKNLILITAFNVGEAYSSFIGSNVTNIQGVSSSNKKNIPFLDQSKDNIINEFE